MSNDEIGNKILASILGKELDFAMMASSLGRALEALTPDQFDTLFCAMMENVQVVPKPGDPISSATFLATGDLIDMLDWSVTDMYRLLLEVAIYNRFIPFALAATGAPNQKTPG